MTKKHGGKREGAGRPPIYPEGVVSRTLSLDARADKAVQAHAEETGQTRSAAASELILRGAGR